MAVFTALAPDQLASWMQQYPLEPCIDLRGIASGIENSNYVLTTGCGSYVLTIFEKLSTHELSFYLNFMRHLAAQRIPVPVPIARTDGALFGLLCGKPAALLSKLNGSIRNAPNAQQCAEVGQMLARLHLAGQSFTAAALPNPRALLWQCAAARAVAPFLTFDQRALLQSELIFQQSVQTSPAYAQLPIGICHGDLFRDNVFFEETQDGCAEPPCRLSGLFDFYFAGQEKWLFDAAICVNDWCIAAADGQLDQTRVHAFLNAYHAVRAFTPLEVSYWPALLRSAALRFWLSRLYDWHAPRPARLLHAHDPRHFERILRVHLDMRPLRALL